MNRAKYLTLTARADRRHLPKVYAVLRRQTRLVAAHVQAKGITETLQQLNTLVMPGPMGAVIAGLYRWTGSNVAEYQTREFKTWEDAPQPQEKAFGNSPIWNGIMNFFYGAFGANKVTRITETSRTWLRTQLEDGAAKGLSNFEMSKTLLSSDVDERRSILITKTEVTTAAGLGQMAAARTSRLSMTKKWNNNNDKRVRRSHKDHEGVGGEVVELEDVFSNGLTQPGDPAAPAREVCNCRCSVTFQPKRDANGRLVRN